MRPVSAHVPVLTSELTTRGGTLVLRLAGELDIAGHEQMHACVEQLLETTREGQSPMHVEVDLAALTFLDASGLGALIRMAAALDHRGHSFETVQVSPAVWRVLVLTGQVEPLRARQAD